MAVEAQYLRALPRVLGLTHLATARAGKVRIVLVAALMLIKAHLPRALRDRPVGFDLDGWGTIRVTDRSELQVAHEIFVARVYESSDLPPEATRIIDLGAHIGLAALYFNGLYPDAEIIAYEADPVAAARAQLNIGHLAQVDVRVCAVSDRDGIVTMHRPGDSWATSEHEKGPEFKTPSVALSTLLADFNQVDILKMDIEGSEHSAVADCPNLTAARCILGEVHPVDGHTTAEFFRALKGFEVASCEVLDGKGIFIAHRNA